jgi:MFS family permease
MTKFFVYLSISFAGMTHGGIMTFVPLYCRYYFSLKNLGTVLGFLTTGNAIGSIIITTLIFPHFYHKYGVYNKNNEEICLEKKCFRFSYGINCIFVIVAIVLAYRLYVEDKNKKIQRRKELNNKIQNTSISCYNDNNMDNSIQAF